MKGRAELVLTADSAALVNNALELPLRPLRCLVRVGPFGQSREDLGRKTGSFARSGVFQRFVSVPRGKRAGGVRDLLSKNRPSILGSLQVRVPVTPATERREVRALIRSPILRSDDVVTDKALSLTALHAAVAVSLLHPGCLLLPPALVQRRTG
jgi:hypothetical protein